MRLRSLWIIDRWFIAPILFPRGPQYRSAKLLGLFLRGHRPRFSGENRKTPRCAALTNGSRPRDPLKSRRRLRRAPILPRGRHGRRNWCSNSRYPAATFGRSNPHDGLRGRRRPDVVPIPIPDNTLSSPFLTQNSRKKGPELPPEYAKTGTADFSAVPVSCEFVPALNDREFQEHPIRS